MVNISNVQHRVSWVLQVYSTASFCVGTSSQMEALPWAGDPCWPGAEPQTLLGAQPGPAELLTTAPAEVAEQPS